MRKMLPILIFSVVFSSHALADETKSYLCYGKHRIVSLKMTNDEKFVDVELIKTAERISSFAQAEDYKSESVIDVLMQAFNLRRLSTSNGDTELRGKWTGDGYNRMCPYGGCPDISKIHIRTEPDGEITVKLIGTLKGASLGDITSSTLNHCKILENQKNAQGI
jgi:hypothetical protein